MPLTLAGMRTEFYARGFDYLSDGGPGLVRTNRWLNDAYHQINEQYPWPYLEAVVAGVAPLTVTDLGEVVTVLTDGRVLAARSQRELAIEYGDLAATTGTPNCYYVTGGNTINTYPGGGTVTVIYQRFAPDLVNDLDEPLVPDRFRPAIIEYAVATALRDDESPSAQVARQAGDEIVGLMRDWAAKLEPRVTYVHLVGDDC